MENILVLAHTEADGSLGKAALEALSVALGLSGAVTVGLVGADTQAAAGQIAGCDATRFLAVTGDAFRQPRYASDAAAAETLCRAAGCPIVIAAGTSRWARALPGVAWRLGGRVDTHATGLAAAGDALALTRWFYRQRMEAVLWAACQRPWVVLLDPGCVMPWNGAPGTATVEAVSVDAHKPRRTAVTGLQAPQVRRTDHPAGRQNAVGGGRRGGPRSRAMARRMRRRRSNLNSRLPA